MKQIALDIGLEAEATLSNFLIGENDQALSQLSHWLDVLYTRLEVPSPLFLWGKTGCGKSHLLRAVYKDLRDHGASIGWMDATITDAVEYNDSWGAILMDDIDRYNSSQQHTAFSWFVNAKTFHAAILSSSSVPPVALAVRDDLRTRMGWGETCQLRVLDDTHCRHALAAAAAEKGVPISADVMDYLMSRFSRNLNSLKELLNMLDIFSLENKRSITIPLIKLMLESN